MKAIDLAGRLLGFLAAVLISLIAVMILLELFLRNIANISLTFAWELSAYCLGSAVFCGAAFTLRSGGHVRVNLISSNVPPRVRYAIELVATLLGLCVAVVLAWAMITFAWHSGVTGKTSATFDATPLVYPQGLVALGALVLALQLAARTVRLIFGADPEDLAERNTYSVDG